MKIAGFLSLCWTTLLQPSFTAWWYIALSLGYMIVGLAWMGGKRRPFQTCDRKGECRCLGFYCLLFSVSFLHNVAPFVIGICSIFSFHVFFVQHMHKCATFSFHVSFLNICVNILHFRRFFSFNICVDVCRCCFRVEKACILFLPNFCCPLFRSGLDKFCCILLLPCHNVV